VLGDTIAKVLQRSDAVTEKNSCDGVLRELYGVHLVNIKNIQILCFPGPYPVSGETSTVAGATFDDVCMRSMSAWCGMNVRKLLTLLKHFMSLLPSCSRNGVSAYCCIFTSNSL